MEIQTAERPELDLRLDAEVVRHVGGQRLQLVHAGGDPGGDAVLSLLQDDQRVYAHGPRERGDSGLLGGRRPGWLGTWRARRWGYARGLRQDLLRRLRWTGLHWWHNGLRTSFSLNIRVASSYNSLF